MVNNLISAVQLTNLGIKYFHTCSGSLEWKFLLTIFTERKYLLMCSQRVLKKASILGSLASYWLIKHLKKVVWILWLGLAERRQKRKMDLAGLEVKEERLERRRSFGSQMQSSVFSELICSRSGYTLKDHSLILSETKKERDAVIGSSLLNIGMTA